MDDTPLDLLCATDANYAMPLAVALTSVVCNLRKRKRLRIFIIESGISIAIKTKVETSIRRNTPPGHIVELHWTVINSRGFDDLPETRTPGGHVSSDTYSRLLAADVLPPDCERVIYLDADTIVIGDLADLWSAADRDCALSAVADGWGTRVSSQSGSTPPIVFNYRELGIPPERPYFNAGVLVMNLKLWRERAIGQQVLAYLRRYHADVVLHDQGGMNAVLHDQWFQLDPRWNQMASILHPRIAAWTAVDARQWRTQLDHPLIVHYEGATKPWHSGFNTPRVSYFDRYWQKTEFYPGRPVSSAVWLERLIGVRRYLYLWNFRFFVSGHLRRLIQRKA